MSVTCNNGYIEVQALIDAVNTNSGEIDTLFSTSTELYIQDGSNPPAKQTGRVITYTTKITTSDSQLSIPISKDGTLSGDPLFIGLESGQCDIHFSVLRDTDADNEAPWAYLRSITANSFNLQIKKSNVDDILVGGTYYGNLNNTNEVQVLVSVTGILNETT